MKLPQLTLRDLFWLVLVVAVLCAWWLDRMRIAARDAALTEREQLLEQTSLALEAQRNALFRHGAALQESLRDVQREREKVALPPLLRSKLWVPSPPGNQNGPE